VFIPPFVVITLYEVLRRIGIERNWLKPGIAQAAFLVVAVGASATQVTSASTTPGIFVRSGMDGLFLSRQLVESTPNVNRVLSDWHTVIGLRLAAPSEQKAKIESFSEPGDEGMSYQDLPYFRPGDVVVLNWDRLNFGRNAYHHAIPEFLDQPPRSWRLLGESKVAQFAIYYIDPE
jgi:hypothetical protein